MTPYIADSTITLFGLTLPAELLFGFFCILMVLCVRLVKSAFIHQQRMTELLQPRIQQQSQDYQALRQEVDLLKATVNQQTMLIDSLSSQQRQLAETAKPADEVSQRLKAQ